MDAMDNDDHAETPGMLTPLGLGDVPAEVRALVVARLPPRDVGACLASARLFHVLSRAQTIDHATMRLAEGYPKGCPCASVPTSRCVLTKAELAAIAKDLDAVLPGHRANVHNATCLPVALRAALSFNQLRLAQAIYARASFTVHGDMARVRGDAPFHRWLFGDCGEAYAVDRHPCDAAGLAFVYGDERAVRWVMGKLGQPTPDPSLLEYDPLAARLLASRSDIAMHWLIETAQRSDATALRWYRTLATWDEKAYNAGVIAGAMSRTTDERALAALWDTFSDLVAGSNALCEAFVDKAAEGGFGALLARASGQAVRVTSTITTQVPDLLCDAMLWRTFGAGACQGGADNMVRLAAGLSAHLGLGFGCEVVIPALRTFELCARQSRTMDAVNALLRLWRPCQNCGAKLRSVARDAKSAHRSFTSCDVHEGDDSDGIARSMVYTVDIATNAIAGRLRRLVLDGDAGAVVELLSGRPDSTPPPHVALHDLVAPTVWDEILADVVDTKTLTIAVERGDVALLEALFGHFVRVATKALEHDAPNASRGATRRKALRLVRKRLRHDSVCKLTEKAVAAPAISDADAVAVLACIESHIGRCPHSSSMCASMATAVRLGRVRCAEWLTSRYDPLTDDEVWLAAVSVGDTARLAALCSRVDECDAAVYQRCRKTIALPWVACIAASHGHLECARYVLDVAARHAADAPRKCARPKRHPSAKRPKIADRPAGADTRHRPSVSASYVVDALTKGHTEAASWMCDTFNVDMRGIDVVRIRGATWRKPHGAAVAHWLDWELPRRTSPTLAKSHRGALALWMFERVYEESLADVAGLVLSQPWESWDIGHDALVRSLCARGSVPLLRELDAARALDFDDQRVAKVMGECGVRDIRVWAEHRATSSCATSSRRTPYDWAWWLSALTD
jgi:hypothetical protein